MNKSIKQNLFLIAFGVLLFGCVLHFGAVLNFVLKIASIVSPVLIGFVLAFILDVPLRFFEQLLRVLFSKTKLKKQPTDATLRTLGLVITFVCVLLVVLLVCTLVIPAIASSVVSLYELVVQKWPEWRDALSEYNINTEQINVWIGSLDIQSIIGKLGNGASNVISSVLTIVSSAISSITGFAISLILSIYVLFANHIENFELKFHNEQKLRLNLFLQLKMFLL